MGNIKKLQRRAERLWKEACHKRDGEECQVRKHFPFVKIKHSDILQVDHCFERGDKNLFLEVSNGTVVCKTCNFLKGNRIGAVDRLIDEIAKKREGETKFNEMLFIALKKSPNLNWKNITWLEAKITELEKRIKGGKV